MNTSTTLGSSRRVTRSGSSTHVLRERLFGVLTLGGAVLFLASWFMPWWQAWIVYLKQVALYIRPWGAESFLPPEYEASISGYEMPAFFALFMWAYFAVFMIMLIYSVIAPSSTRIGIGKLSLPLPTALVLGVGISYIVCIVIAYFVMQMRVSEYFNASLNGTIYIAIDEGHKSNVDTSLLPGFYLAAVTGPVLVILALLRGLIVGKSNV